jgi:CRP-like cAMP-binding protein
MRFVGRRAEEGNVEAVLPAPREGARLDYGQALSAEMLSEIAQLIGTDLALSFARRFGGSRLYIPRRPPIDHPITRCVGIRAAERLGRAFGGESFVVPGACGFLRWLDARALRILGLSHAQIGQLLGVQDRHVRRLLRGFKPEDYAIDDTVRAVAKVYGIRLVREVKPQQLSASTDPAR